MKGWLKRFKTDALNILGHIAWGMLAGVLGGIDGTAFLAGGFAYQFGSGYRHVVNEGKADTIGLDCVDYALGYIIAVVIRVVLAIEGVPMELPHLTEH